MKLRTLLINQELIKQIVRNVGWVGIVYTFLLFLLVPFTYYGRIRGVIKMNQQRRLPTEVLENFYESLKVSSIFEINELQGILFGVAPVLMAIFLFRYFMVSRSADFMHSIPVSRKTLFGYHIVVGVIFLIIPPMITGVTLKVIQLCYADYAILSVKQVLTWLGVVSLLTLCLFFIGIFAATISGNSVVHFLTTCGLIFLPIFLFGLYQTFGQVFFYGFYPMIDFNSIEYLSPFTRLINTLASHNLSGLEVLIYLGITFITLVLSYFLYPYRKTEKATSAFAFPFFKPVFKYGAALLMMYLGAEYFSWFDNQYWVIFGSVVGAFIGFLIAEAFLRKSWRVIPSLKELVIFLVITTITVLCLTIDPFGYEERIPKIDEVKSVYFTEDYQTTSNPEIKQLKMEIESFTQPESIAAIRQLHQDLVDHQDTNAVEEDPNAVYHAYFVYQLKNGKKLIRDYQVIDNQTNIEEVRMLAENRANKSELLQAIKKYVHGSNLYLNGNAAINESSYFSKDKTLELLDAVNQDMQNDRNIPDKMSAGSLFLSVEYGDTNREIIIKPSYQNTINWLIKQDDQLVYWIDANQIKQITVYQINQWSDTMLDEWSDQIDPNALLIQNSQIIAKVEDTASINELFLEADGFFGKENENFIQVLYANGESRYLVIPKELASRYHQ